MIKIKIFYEFILSATILMYFDESNLNHAFLLFRYFLLILYSVKIFIIPTVFKRNKTKTDWMFLSFISQTWFSTNFYFSLKFSNIVLSQLSFPFWLCYTIWVLIFTLQLKVICKLFHVVHYYFLHFVFCFFLYIYHYSRILKYVVINWNLL